LIYLVIQAIAMSSFSFLLLRVSVALLVWGFPSFLGAQNATEILEKMIDFTRGDRVFSEIHMEVVRPRFTREIAMKSWSMGGEYSLVLITAPARDQGIAYLKRGKEVWNWVPNIDRIIKLPPAMMSQSWMGSDFTNDDLVRETAVLEDYSARLLGKERVEGYECYKIQLIPKEGSAVVFSKVILWISTQYYFQLKSEQYGEKDQLVNRILYSDIKELGGRTMPSKITLYPLDKKGHKTILIQKHLDFSPAIDESFFTLQNLKRVQ
jgi:hypothetical protein